MRTPAGFLLLMNNQHTVFEKPPLSIEAQLERLKSRGIIIQDEAAARSYLSFISYYRFCGYAIEFEDRLVIGEKQYRKGTTFEEILDHYVFDRKLRLLVIDAIERIEIAIRTVITNEMAMKYDDAHWYLKRNLFLEKFKHAALIKTIEKESHYKTKDGMTKRTRPERFIEHYFKKYKSPELPAVWMIAEILSLGSWSMIFDNLALRQDQKAVSLHFNLDSKVIGSWLHALTYLRNLCAHHCKLWNRNFTLKPLVANTFRNQMQNNGKFSAQATMLKVFLDVISPGSTWAENLRALIKQHPGIDVTKMGFKEDWENDNFWG